MSETFKAEDYQTKIETEGNWKLRVTSYKLADTYVCTVDNVDPGATIARAEASAREEAESVALEKARQRIRRTRVTE